MGNIAKDWLVFVLAGIAGAVLLLTGLSGTAAAATEPEYSLSASPDSISWPDAPDLQYRLHVQAGSDPLDVTLKFPDPGWGSDRVDGSVFNPGFAELDGPGELTPGDMPPIVPPRLGTCFRGAVSWASVMYYGLSLDAGQSTTVTVDSQLTAAPFPGTPREIRALVWSDGTEPVELTSSISITGIPGALIESWFVGAGSAGWIDRGAAQSFRLVGQTNPPLANRAIRVEAKPESWGEDYRRQMLLGTVRTDADGGFKTGPLYLYDPGVWSLRTTLAKPGEFDPEPNCAGAVTVAPAQGKLTESALNDHTYRSVKVVGRTIGQKRIRLQFFRHANQPNLPVRPTLVAHAGCNSMGASYRAANGRLRWVGPVVGTTMGCSKARMGNDRWLQRLLRKGVKAKLNGRRLTLTRGKTRIVLRQTS